MESAIAAIISGLFTLAALWFKDYLDRRKSQQTYKASLEEQASNINRSAEADRTLDIKVQNDNKFVTHSLKEESPKLKDSSKVSGVLKFLLFLLFVSSVVSVGLCWFYDTESIIVGGPIISIIGIFIAWWAHKENSRSSIIYGLSAPSVSLLCLVLIASLSWSPNEARGPISFIGSAYSIFLLIVILTTFTKSPNKANPADACTSRD